MNQSGPVSSEPDQVWVRDIFLSHRSTDREFVQRLAEDIEAETYQDRRLLTWVDEAEIRPGQSVPGMVNEGLEKSRLVGLAMTPAYFESESGWTDAEWHSALYVDPDNRGARIVPLLVADCPYIPYLLRHLRAIDFRRGRYSKALEELLAVLRDEPLPRPIAHRGQLLTSTGHIDRSTLVAERAVPQADPDVVPETLYCNLLPVERLPKYVYTGAVSTAHDRLRRNGSKAPPSKQEIKDLIREAQRKTGVERPFMPAFRVLEGRIVTFHDLESHAGPFHGVVEDEDVDRIPTTELVRDKDDRNIIVSLLNMAIDRHATRIGLVIDNTKYRRFFFPPKDAGPNVIAWKPRATKASRTVAKPCTKDGRVLFWRHLGAYLRVLFLANQFYLQITPTWVLTTDGWSVRTGPRVGQSVIKWTGAERNLQVLYHVRFWTTVLSISPGPAISVRAGDQWLEIATAPAFVEQPYGVAGDQRDLMRLLDQEASLIAENEEMLADLATEAELAQVTEAVEEDVIGAGMDEEA